MASDLICIRTFVHRYEADIAVSLLQSQNLPAMVMAEDQGGLSPHLLAASGGARLIVRAEDAEAALHLLDEDPVDVTDFAEDTSA